MPLRSDRTVPRSTTSLKFIDLSSSCRLLSGGGQIVSVLQAIRDLGPARAAIDPHANPSRRAGVRRLEIAIWRLADKEVLCHERCLAPDGMPSGTVVVAGVRQHRKHPFPHPERRLAVRQLFPRARQGEAESPYALERIRCRSHNLVPVTITACFNTLSRFSGNPKSKTSESVRADSISPPAFVMASSGRSRPP